MLLLLLLALLLLRYNAIRWRCNLVGRAQNCLQQQQQQPRDIRLENDPMANNSGDGDDDDDIAPVICLSARAGASLRHRLDGPKRTDVV